MLISRETDYAFRIIRNLKLDEPTSIAAIVEKEYITTAIAYKVARKIEQGNLIVSIRGNAGGYQLARGLDEITPLDVLKVMNPDLAVNDCLKLGAECPRNTDQEPCCVHYELERIQNVLFLELSRYTLLEIVERGSKGLDYLQEVAKSPLMDEDNDKN